MPMTEVFTGNNGTLTVATEDNPEGQDAKLVLDTYQFQTVGRVTGVEVRVNTALKGFYEVGRRHPVSLSPGDIEIRGKVGRAYVNGALLFLLLGRGASPNLVAEPYVQPAFGLTVALADPARPGISATIEFRGVKFENWAYVVPEDDFVLENLSFMALTVSVIDREGTPESPASPQNPLPADA